MTSCWRYNHFIITACVQWVMAQFTDAYMRQQASMYFQITGDNFAYNWHSFYSCLNSYIAIATKFAHDNYAVVPCAKFVAVWWPDNELQQMWFITFEIGVKHHHWNVSLARITALVSRRNFCSAFILPAEEFAHLGYIIFRQLLELLSWYHTILVKSL